MVCHPKFKFKTPESVPLFSLLASGRRRAWRVVTPLALLATVGPKEIGVPALHLHFRLRPLLRLLHCHEHYAVTLHVPLTFFVLDLVLRRVVMLVDSGGSARALPP